MEKKVYEAPTLLSHQPIQFETNISGGGCSYTGGWTGSWTGGCDSTGSTGSTGGCGGFTD